MNLLKELFEALTAIDPVEQPEQYLNLLDQYELEQLRIKQEERRKKLMEKMQHENPLHLRVG